MGVRRIRMPSEPKTASKLSVNLESRSRMRNLNCPTWSPRSMSRLRACWVTRHSQNVDPAAGDLHHEQHVQAREQHRVDVEEVACQHGFGLGGQELPPGQSCAAWRWIDAGAFEQQPHGAWRDPASK